MSQRLHSILLRIAALFLFALGSTLASRPVLAADAAATPNWSLNATIIEACSCPMFCQCYFSTKPAAHGGEHAEHGGMAAEHYCRANNVFRVNKGTYGSTKLDGAKFWIGMDLGAEFSDGEMDWAVLHFDPSVTKEQRAGIVAALGKLYPVKWKSFVVGADAPIEWAATKDRATAKLNGGKDGEVVLARSASSNTSDPTVIQNLKYWGAPRNDGFVLMPNEVEAYRLTDKAFEYKGTNGFMITFDITSKD
ncbi:MAG TPA: DUF1326 domain-containing protein [Candidatus Eisenbacteria bacterium]|nr:DUF1326 domain-containing protein [Candidatus Eisenbacteria bacterium]